MNLAYLYSIIKLYVQREKNGKHSYMTIEKKQETFDFRFSMQNNSQDHTIVTLPLDLVNENKSNILKLYHEGKIVINEENDVNKYIITFNNGRTLIFENFTCNDINNWRNSLFNISIRDNEIRLVAPTVEEKQNYQYQLKRTGFTSFVNLILTVFVISIALFIGLWLFKNIM